MHAVGDPEAAGDAFDQLRFARAESAGQSDHLAGRRLTAPLFTQRHGFFRAFGNERSHELTAA